MKKTLSVILAVIMMVTMLPFAFAAEKTLEISMKDRYFDGWNGASIEIVKIVDGTGEYFGRAKVTDGGASTSVFTLDADATYVLSWVAGAYDEECAFVINLDGKIIVDVPYFSAPQDGDVLSVIGKHDIVDGVCTDCGYTCGKEIAHSYSSETGICVCGAECEHEFTESDICDICGSVCKHKEFVPPSTTAAFVEGSAGYESYECADSLFDGDKDTKWCSVFDEDNKPYVIFSIPAEAKLLFYTLTTGDDAYFYYERNWTDWTIYGSDSENGEWTPVHQVTGAELPHGSLKESDVFEVNAETAYRYYKLVVDMNGGIGQWGNAQQMTDISLVFSDAEGLVCADCGAKYEDVMPEEPTLPEEDTEAEICELCGTEHDKLLVRVICIIREFFLLIAKALRIG